MEPLGKNHRTYAPWPEVRYFFGPINIILPLFILHKFQMPPGYQSVPRVFSKCCECFVSMCVCGVCEFRDVCETKLLRFCFKEVTFDP
jgi:hypothetical protein